MNKQKNKYVDELEKTEQRLGTLFDTRRAKWEYNILMYRGDHWLEYLVGEKAWRSSAYRFKGIDNNYPTPVTNLVFEQGFTLGSNLIQNFPLPYAYNKVSSQKAKRAANCANYIIKYYADPTQLDYTKMNMDIFNWCYVNGGCIVVPHWNLETGKYESIYKTENRTETTNKEILSCEVCGSENKIENKICTVCGSDKLLPIFVPQENSSDFPVLDKNGYPVIKEKVPIGDPACDVTPYFEWLFDPLAQEVKQCRWIIRRRVKEIDWVEDTFNVKNIKSDSGEKDKYWYVPRLNSWSPIAGSNVYQKTEISEFTEHTCSFKQYYIKPKSLKDKGKLITVAGGVQVDEQDFPWEDGKYRFIHYRYAKVAGSFYGQSLIDSLIPINLIINRIDQQLIWNRHTCVDPIIVNPIGTGVGQDEFMGMLGRYIEPSGDVMPFYLQSAPLPVQVFEERNLRKNDLELIGHSDPMSGKLPQGRTPAKSISMMLEQSATKQSLFLKDFQNGNIQLWTEVLRLCRENMPEERAFLLMGGDEEEYDSNAFISGKELNGDEQYDSGGVIVGINWDEMIPRSRVAEKETLKEMMMTGALNPNDPLVKQAIFKIFGGDIETLGKNINIDIKKAQREIVEMEEGIDITANYKNKYPQPQVPNPQTGQQMENPMNGLFPGESVLIHVEIHRQDIQKEKFQELKPEIQKIKMEHYLKTTTAAQQQQQQQMLIQASMAQAMKGAPSM